MPSYCHQCRESKVANKGDLCSTCEVENKMTPKEKEDRAAIFALIRSRTIPANRRVKRVFSPAELDSRSKPGPKPKGPERLYVYERVYDLHKSGLSFGEIGQRIWNDPSKRNRASAHYQRALKQGFPRIKPSGK